MLFYCCSILTGWQTLYTNDLTADSLKQDLMFSEEDAEYSEALKMGPISAIVLDGDAKEPRVGMVSI